MFEMQGQDHHSEFEDSLDSTVSSLSQSRLQRESMIQKVANNQFMNKVGPLCVSRDKIFLENEMSPRKETALCVSLPSGDGCNLVKNRGRSWEEAGLLHSVLCFLSSWECMNPATLGP